MTEARRVLIVDDEAPARTNLRLALQAAGGWRVQGEAGDAGAARALLDQHPCELLFLDVQMPGESGLQLARSLAACVQPPIIVFVTAYDAFAIEAFEAHALDYLLKPVDDRRLAQTLERAAWLIDLQQRDTYASAVRELPDALTPDPTSSAPPLHSLCVRSVRRIERIELDQVEWIGSAGNYIELHLPDRVVLHRATLAWIEQRLCPRSFLRVHRTRLVRRERIRALRSDGDSHRLITSSGESIAVSPRHLADVRALLADDG
jgi:two-component system LytT family response regulator